MEQIYQGISNYQPGYLVQGQGLPAVIQLENVSQATPIIYVKPTTTILRLRATAASDTGYISLSNGSYYGQKLIVQVTGSQQLTDANTGENTALASVTILNTVYLNSGNTRLSASWKGQPGATLCLMWDGAYWNQTDLNDVCYLHYEIGSTAISALNSNPLLLLPPYSGKTYLLNDLVFRFNYNLTQYQATGAYVFLYYAPVNNPTLSSITNVITMYDEDVIVGEETGAWYSKFAVYQQDNFPNYPVTQLPANSGLHLLTYQNMGVYIGVYDYNSGTQAITAAESFLEGDGTIDLRVSYKINDNLTSDILA